MRTGIVRLRTMLMRVAAASSFGAIALSAQDSTTAAPMPSPARTAPFSSIRIEVAGLGNVNRERLHESWDPEGGVAIEIGTPLPLGVASLGIARLPFRAREEDQPDFAARMVTLRWGLERQLVGPVGAGASLVMGNFHMRFDDGDRAQQGLETESELLVGARGSLDLAIAHRFFAIVSASYERVLTRREIELVILRAGLRFTAPAPGWLRRVLE